MKILSVFDGMACGMLAMMEAGVIVDRYVAYEIDKYAIQTSSHNFPVIEHRGDVFKGDFTEFEGFDFLVGGSPCTYWSIAQTKNRETEASGMGWELFSQYARALREAKPKYFIYENNKSMSKEIKRCISETFGFEPICINSALVSAQNRQRLYWVGKRNADGTYSKVDIGQPADKGILLRDILETGRNLSEEKAYCLTANYHKGFGTNPGKPIEKHRSSMVAEPVGVTNGGKSFAVTAYYSTGQNAPHTIEKSLGSMVSEPVCVAKRGRMYREQPQHYEARTDGKTNTLTSVEKDNRVAETVCMRYERTDEAKKCRRAYEAHEMKHGYHELSELHPRIDGKTNTLSTVLKDNPICEPVNTTDEGKSQTIKAQYCKTSIANVCCYDSTYGASGVAERIPPFSSGKSRAVDSHYGKLESGGTAVVGRMNSDNPSKQQHDFIAESVDGICQVGAMPMPNGEISTSAGFRVYSPDAKGRYLCANGGGAGAKTGLYALPVDEPMRVAEATKKGYATIPMGGCADMTQLCSKTRRGREMEDKSNCLTTSCEYYQYCAKLVYATPCELDENGTPTKAISCADGKTYPVYKVENGKITIKEKQYPIKLLDGCYIIRKLTVLECMRLQTVPEWYEFPVSPTQAYKMLGNGWTVSVITHLIQSCLKTERGDDAVMDNLYIFDCE